MLYLFFSLLITSSLGSGHDHDHDDEDCGHIGHQHSSDIATCECTTGIATEQLDLNCDDDDFQSNLDGLEAYLTDNDCSQYCNNLMYIGSESDPESAFRCYQVFSLIVQYHDYCESGTVDESVFHEYLEACPDCYQNHYQVDGAPECDSCLNCTDSEHQIEDVEFLLENCIDACPDSIVHEGEHESCTEIWQHVEGYHRMCAHTELVEEFDELFDQLAFEKTVCEDTHCNVPWENATVNCSDANNMQYTMLRTTYGTLNISDIVGEYIITTSMEPDKGYQLMITIVGFVSILFTMFV